MNKKYHFVIRENGYGRKMYNTFRHNLEYKENYFKKLFISLLICFLVCIGMIFILG